MHRPASKKNGSEWDGARLLTGPGDCEQRGTAALSHLSRPKFWIGMRAGFWQEHEFGEAGVAATCAADPGAEDCVGINTPAAFRT